MGALGDEFPHTGVLNLKKIVKLKRKNLCKVKGKTV